MYEGPQIYGALQVHAFWDRVRIRPCRLYNMPRPGLYTWIRYRAEFGFCRSNHVGVGRAAVTKIIELRSARKKWPITSCLSRSSNRHGSIGYLWLPSSDL